MPNSDIDLGHLRIPYSSNRLAQQPNIAASRRNIRTGRLIHPSVMAGPAQSVPIPLKASGALHYSNICMIHSAPAVSKPAG